MPLPDLQQYVSDFTGCGLHGKIINMRTKLLIISLIFTISFGFVNGQELNHAKKFNIGAEGGLQFTNLRSFLYPYSPQAKTGFFAGIFGEYNISRTFKIRLGLQYDKRSFELYGYELFTDTTGSFHGTYHLYQVDYDVNYLTIPLNISFVRGSDKFKIYLQAGLYYSIYMNAKQNGIDYFYIDENDKKYFTNSILDKEENIFYIDGSTDGLTFLDISDTESEQPTYDIVKYNFYDFGFNFYIGLVYQPTPSIGLTFGPGFSYSLANAFEDPAYNFDWSQITRVNIGFIYTLNMNRRAFGQQ